MTQARGGITASRARLVRSDEADPITAAAPIREGLRAMIDASHIPSTVTRMSSPPPAAIANVLGTPLQDCSHDPLTGYFRDGCCRASAQDLGTHVVCARVTAEFLEFSAAQGNDLVTPHPEWQFPGLKPGDQWCLCVLRWKEAAEAGVAPPVVLEATHIRALEFVSLADLKYHAFRVRTE